MSNMELERFKTEINLTEYAAAQGYALIRQESSRNSATMRHPHGDKIIVAKAEDNHWIYFSVRDDRDNGSIIDFVQKRRRCSLGQVRQVLRAWIGGDCPRISSRNFVLNLEPSSTDRQKVISTYGRMRDVTEHSYLEGRAVGKECLSNRRFRGRVRMDKHFNAVFPHYNEQGLCGYEIKNKGFTGFAPGGDKGLWVSNTFPEDERLVITESAIDALSFYILEGMGTDRYVSTAGEWNPNTSSLLRRAGETLPGNTIVLAFDNDATGEKYEKQSRALFRESSKQVVTLFPTAKDWNDVLRNIPFSVLPQKIK